MKDKILAALKTKFKNLGFGDTALTGVADILASTVTEEEQIEATISGAEPMLKAFQGEIDRRVTGLKSELETLKKAQKPKSQDDEDVTPDPEWKKEIASMKAELEQMRKSETLAKHTQALRDKLKAEGVTEKFIQVATARLTVEKPEDVDQIAAEIKTAFTETNQELINQGLLAEAPRQASQPETKEEMDAYLKDKFPEVKN